MKPVKKVTFNNTAVIYKTYSPDEYCRHQIDSVLYRKMYNRISQEEWNNIYITLDIYKLYEMIVHKDSLKNNSYSLNKFDFKNI